MRNARCVISPYASLARTVTIPRAFVPMTTVSARMARSVMTETASLVTDRAPLLVLAVLVAKNVTSVRVNVSTKATIAPQVWSAMVGNVRHVLWLATMRVQVARSVTAKRAFVSTKRQIAAGRRSVKKGRKSVSSYGSELPPSTTTAAAGRPSPGGGEA